MSQKALDLRRSMQILRRRKVFLLVLVVLGVLGGAAYAVVKPAMLTSSALVAITPSARTQQPAAAAGTTTGTDPSTATQEVVADSSLVLEGALPDVRPAMSLSDLRLKVVVASPATDIISVTAQGKTAADAEATANAVANSYVNYVSSSSSAVGHVQAQVLESARTASGPSPIERTIVFALLGGLGGVVVGMIVALALGRNDRRLRERDEIAKSIGIPVLASVPAARPSAAAGWISLLEDYNPSAVHAWQLRAALQQLGMSRPGPGRPLYSANGNSPYAEGRAAVDDDYFSLTVVSLASDRGALALGPQLAAFAAAQKIPTLLVIGPAPDDAAAAATLRVACAAPLPDSSIHHGLLRVATSDGGDVGDLRSDAALVIVVAVAAGRAAEVPGTMRTSATVIGVSAGAATAEQLARAAVAAAADGQEITGILVADPEPTDQTTGRIPLANPASRRSPTRLRGIATEIRR
jgi:capsular polysaccharide biosynthesis protein